MGCTYGLTWFMAFLTETALAWLPMEVSMVRTTPTLPSLGDEQLGFLTGSVKDYIKFIFSHGSRRQPVPFKILGKICKWEYVTNQNTHYSQNHVGIIGSGLVVLPMGLDR